MSELILHIGTSKTGTTSLQKFFSVNRESFRKHGISYPSFTEQPWPALVKNGVFLNRYCLALAKEEDPRLSLNEVDENLQTLAASLTSFQTTLISDENLFLAPSWLMDLGYRPESYWPTLADTLAEAGAQNITVIAYLRRQDEWAFSQWRQIVKTGWQKQSLDVFCDKSINRYAMDYENILRSAGAAFGGNAKIIVRRYDRSSFEGANIYFDFCTACGIPFEDSYEIPQSEVNTSLSFDVAEALRVFVDAAPPRTPLRQNILVPLARKLSKRNPDAPGITPFDEEATRKLMEPYLEGNKRISKKYLSGRALFSEEYGGRPVWVPNEDRIAEYRTAFEDAIQEYMLREDKPVRIRALAINPPEGIKRPLGATLKRLFGQ